MYTRVVRLDDADDVSASVAAALLDRVIDLQATQAIVHLCLTGGDTANAMYEKFAELAPDSGLDASKLQLWWGDERFVPATDPARNSLQAISRLARTISIKSADTHMMAAADGRKDPHESAAEYEAELGETTFDITLLGIGRDGHVASLFPGHPSSATTTRAVIGVTDSPKEPSERITLTQQSLSRSHEVWFIATGEKKAEAVSAALDPSPDATLPGAMIRGTTATLWFLDRGAASGLAPQYNCPF